jgi:hypothetical protein
VISRDFPAGCFTRGPRGSASRAQRDYWLAEVNAPSRVIMQRRGKILESRRGGPEAAIATPEISSGSHLSASGNQS